MSEKEIKYCKALLRLFKIEGHRADEVATAGQIEIFFSIVSRKWNRVQVESSTQYGKSLFIALGCVILACVDGEIISIVAPTNDKAQIIMRYFIQHLGDYYLFSQQLLKESSLEKLQMETKKDRVTLKNGGGIFTLSVQAGNTQKGFQAAMGEGSKIVIQDESSLIPDDIESTVYRMIAGKKNAIYIKVGNPFYRNHFYKSSIDPRYHKIFIDYHQGIREGRYQEDFIEEAKRKPFFSVLYACQFPDDDVVDQQGWTRLFPDALIEHVQRTNVIPYGENRMGCDIAEGGGDSNSFVMRSANHARVLAKFQSPDTMQTCGMIIQYGKEHDIFDHNWFVDSLGVGKGCFDRLAELGYRPYNIRFSEKAQDEQQFSNTRAECYWRAFKWLNEGGSLEPNSEWQQLATIRYKVDSQGRIQIISKEIMRKEGYGSPDSVDAFVSTFARKNIVNVSREEMRKEFKILKEFDAFTHKNKKERLTMLKHAKMEASRRTT